MDNSKEKNLWWLGIRTLNLSTHIALSDWLPFRKCWLTSSSSLLGPNWGSLHRDCYCYYIGFQQSTQSLHIHWCSHPPAWLANKLPQESPANWFVWWLRTQKGNTKHEPWVLENLKKLLKLKEPMKFCEGSWMENKSSWNQSMAEALKKLLWLFFNRSGDF